MRGTTRLGRWSTGGAALVLAVSLAACGSDDDGGDDGDTQAAETSAAEETADPAAFCEAAVEIEGAMAMGPPIDETTPPEEQQAALEEFGAMLEPLLSEVEETAPEEISEHVTTAADITREALSTGDPSATESPEFMEADDAMDEYMLAECGFEALEATGVDYEYEGLPDTVTAGTVAVTFDNQGTELHEIVLLRINDDVTQPIEELLALPEEEAMTMATPAGFAFAPAGESDTTFMELEPGRYAAVCFIPEGTTSMDMPGMGAPHFTMGMFAEFTAE